MICFTNSLIRQLHHFASDFDRVLLQRVGRGCYEDASDLSATSRACRARAWNLENDTTHAQTGDTTCIQSAPIKNNPLVKIHYLSYCNRFFHQIYSFHRGGFRPYTQQISLQHLLFRHYNRLNFKMCFFSK